MALPSSAPRIYYAPSGLPADDATRERLLAGVGRDGFSAVLVPVPWLCPANARSLAPVDADRAPAPDGGTGPLPARLARDAGEAAKHGLELLLRLELQRVARDAVDSTAPAAWYHDPVDDPARDPRLSLAEHGVRQLREDPPAGFVDAWAARLLRWTRAGVGGYVVQPPPHLDAQTWRSLFAPARQADPALRCLAWTPGLAPAALARLRDAGFDGVFSSLPWWDYRSPWLAEELERLREVAPVIAPTGALDEARPDTPVASDARRAWSAALSASGWLAADADRAAGAAQVNAWLRDAHCPAPPRLVVGRDGGATLLLRDTADEGAALLALNPDDRSPARLDWDLAAGLLPAGTIVARGDTAVGAPLPPAACARYELAPAAPVRLSPRATSATATTRGDGVGQARIAIEQIVPAVDGGAFPVKCGVHDAVQVEADIFMDGHDRLAAELRWRADDEPAWRAVPLVPVGNDRWSASFRPDRIGPHAFQVAAWHDGWETFRHELEVKHAAGASLRLEREEGLQLLRAADQRASQAATPGAGLIKRALRACAAPAPDSEPDAAQIETLLDPALAQAMRSHDSRPFESLSAIHPLWVDRPRATHAAWYELFPRSESGDPTRHGTFDDVIRRLPQIAAMGFDVLYFPPIHPIGRTHRKGRNNSLRAGPDDPGSPYAIGSEDGGHEAIHPELGNLEDFRRLVDAAREHGLEMALDFAIQCSPDHPWLREHPGWFAWRPDGSLRYAENPPKKYEDIVNVDFYAEQALPSLWEALRDVVLGWVEQGVTLLPRRQPAHQAAAVLGVADRRGARPPSAGDLPFRGLHPPGDDGAPGQGRLQPELHLLHLAQRQGGAGGVPRRTQPATLARLLPAELLRQHAGHQSLVPATLRPPRLPHPCRPGDHGVGAVGHVLRLRAVRGRARAGQGGVPRLREIPAAPARLPGAGQHRRRDRPAQSHPSGKPGIADAPRVDGLQAYNAWNDRILYFGKRTADLANFILVAVSLDPHEAQEAHFELPLWEFGLPDDASLQGEDLMNGHRWVWHGKRQWMRIEPWHLPFGIWRVLLASW